MPLSVKPHLKETKDAFAFLTCEVSSHFVMLEDEHNPGLSYVMVQKNAVGFHYEKQGEKEFAAYVLRLKRLITFASDCPESNILGEYVWWASFHDILWEIKNEGPYQDPAVEALNKDYIIKLPPDAVEIKSDGNPEPPHNLEDAGVVGFYDFIRPDKRYTVIFENTLGYEIHGLDVLLKDNETGKVIIVELKGNSRPIRSPLSYLKKTKNKGRQMSWIWIFKSLLSSYNSMAASSVLLHCLGPLFENRIERWVSVSHAKKQQSHWSVDEIKFYKEEDLKKYPQLNESKELGKWSEAYKELMKIGLLSV